MYYCLTLLLFLYIIYKSVHLLVNSIFSPEKNKRAGFFLTRFIMPVNLTFNMSECL